MLEVLFYIFVSVVFVTSLVIAMHVLAFMAGVWCIKFAKDLLAEKNDDKT